MREINKTNSEEVSVIRIDPYYFYRLGLSLNPLTELEAESPLQDAILDLYIARRTLEQLFDGFYPFRACVNAGHTLLENVERVIEKYNADKTAKLESYDAYRISSPLKEFQTVLVAEMRTLDTYHASQKALYSTQDLIERAEIVLPETIRGTVPEETINEIRAGGKCLAFELPTACGFHIVRATEAVIREYYQTVVGTVPKVKARNWGSYIKLLKDRGADGKITTVLEQIKDTYRNPIVHPEDVLEMEDAIILFGMAQGVIVSMMKDIATRRAASGKSTALPLPATVATVP
jgi:hypothetical protein